MKVAAPILSRLANFDDADPLRLEPDVQFVFVPAGRPIPRDADVVLLFGTKSTIGDLAFLREQGWDHDILAHARAGGRVVGVCGGLQMLGRRVHDPAGADGPAGSFDGLGLLDVETTMHVEKTVRRARGRYALSDAPVSGYEIHTGQTHGADLARPMFQLKTGTDGARSLDGLVEGTYLHGLFANDADRRAWIERVGVGTASSPRYEATVDPRWTRWRPRWPRPLIWTRCSGHRVGRTSLPAELRESLSVQGLSAPGGGWPSGRRARRPW